MQGGCTSSSSAADTRFLRNAAERRKEKGVFRTHETVPSIEGTMSDHFNKIASKKTNEPETTDPNENESRRKEKQRILKRIEEIKNAINRLKREVSEMTSILEKREEYENSSGSSRTCEIPALDTTLHFDHICLDVEQDEDTDDILDSPSDRLDLHNLNQGF